MKNSDLVLFQHCHVLIYGAHAELRRIIDDNPDIHEDLGFPKSRIQQLREESQAIVDAGSTVYSQQWQQIRAHCLPNLGGSQEAN